MSEELLLAIVAGVVIIVFASSLSARLGVAGPLILLAAGVGISLLPFVPAISVAPDLILMGVLPPLLYSSAVSAPAIELRRDLSAIGGLSVALVIISALAVGGIVYLLVPDLGFPLSVALGAILSPTDAVATTIVHRLGVPERVVTVLEGESLVNDASALVTLRTAVVAAAAGFSFLTSVGRFAWAVIAAVVIGGAVGWVATQLRARITSSTANTALGFTIPYLAFLPSEAVGGSGLVAAVIAGVVCGQGSVRRLTAEQRVSDKQNWQTIEFVLEGAVFLIMGLELWGIVQSHLAAHGSILHGILIATLAFLTLLAVRTLYVVPMLSLHNRRVRKAVRRRADSPRLRTERRMSRTSADADYFATSPLTWRHNTVIIWAGMRGAVTLAAAQTLPGGTPERDTLVFIAFLVAAGSLLLQGLTLPALVRILGLRKAGGIPREEVRQIDRQLRKAARKAIDDRALVAPDGRAFSAELYSLPTSQLVERDRIPHTRSIDSLEFELAAIDVMRTRMHALGRSGRYSTSALRHVLAELDAYEIGVRLQLESER